MREAGRAGMLSTWTCVEHRRGDKGEGLARGRPEDALLEASCAIRTTLKDARMCGSRGEVVCTLPVTLASRHRWLLPPQALNAYYLPNKNQMGKETCPALPAAAGWA